METKEIYTTYVKIPALYDGAFHFSNMLIIFRQRGVVGKCLQNFPLMLKNY